MYCERIDNGWVLLVVLFYAAAFALARWHFVARPHLHNLHGQIEEVRQWMRAHPQPAGSTAPGDDLIEGLLKQAEDLASPGKVDLIDKVLWSRGQDFMGLRLLYKARELLTPRESPESLRATLESAAKSLESGDAEDKALAVRVRLELIGAPMDVRDGGPALMQELQAYLARFDSELDDEVKRLAAANGGATPPTPQAAQALLARMSTALAPPPALARRLAAATALPGAWQVLAEHAHDVALPAAAARHQALQALATASPAPTVDACVAALQSTRDERRALQGLADRLKAALAAAPLAASERRLLLATAAREHMHFMNLLEYDKQVTWHRKNYWLGLSSLALLLLLASAAGNPLLFLVGAFGGLLSRLRLAVTSGGTRDSEDLHWTTIFLSPVMGALAAWGGMLLISLGLHFQVLGTMFEQLVWSAPLSPTLLGVALMLGFAERLFLDVAQRIQSKLGSSEQEAKAAK